MENTHYFVRFEGTLLYAGETLLSCAELSVRLSPPFWHDLEYSASDADGTRTLAYWEKREISRYIDDLTWKD